MAKLRGVKYLTVGQVSAKRLALMLSGWAAGDGPLHKKLAGALRHAIERGDLTPVTRVSSERSLAQALAVSRTTVVAAYDVLRNEGLLTSRQGSGTWVSVSRSRRRELTSAAAMFPWVHRIRPDHEVVGLPSGFIDLTAVALSAAAPVLNGLHSITNHDWLALTSVQGYFPLGLSLMREAIAQDFERRGIPTAEDQIIVTTGAQQGLDLIASTLLQPGDAVVVEDPTYAGALPVLRKAGARLLSAPMDNQGVRVDILERLVARESVKLIYLNPTNHNPTGTSLSEARRWRVDSLAKCNDITVVESTVQADLSLSGAPTRYLATGRPHDEVLTIGSMSALFWSGLRIGWVRGPTQAIFQLGKLKGTVDLGTPLVDQLLAARLLPLIDEVSRWRRKQLRERLDLVTSMLPALLPEWKWETPSGGTSLWVRLPCEGAGEFCQVALRHGVMILPGSSFSAGGAYDDHLRIPFVIEPPALRAGIERLAAAWSEYSARHIPSSVSTSAISNNGHRKKAGPGRTRTSANQSAS